MEIDFQYRDQNNGKKLKILVTGASGFIGSRLLRQLIKANIENSGNQATRYSIRCLTRNKSSFNTSNHYEEDGLSSRVEVVEGDLSNYEDCLKALKDIDIAYYLVHSMEGSTKDWKKFSEKEQKTAENFTNAADQCGVKRIIYLGGLTHSKESELSQHMLSRKLVGDILRRSNAEVTIYRAAVILGSGGGSFEMLRYLVERLPIMICPKWVLTNCQPIFTDDVITYLYRSIETPQTEGKIFDIGGPDILTYLDMMKIYARLLKKSIKVLIIPFLTPRLSSYWVDLVTPIKASLARPLIDSLKHEAIVKDDLINKIIPIDLKSFEASLRYCIDEESRYTKKKDKSNFRKERTSLSSNYRILLISLFLLLAIGTTYYFLDTRTQFLEPFWLFIAVVWYLLIFVSIYFVRFGARLGALVAGLLGWGSLGFWLLDIFQMVAGYSIMVQKPNNQELWRDIIGIIVASFTIMSSHNIFHKIRLYT
ncbi:NAD-dependent epimerase/dehydratase family protein [Candidatus Nitrosocosmicus franklandus]|uniref:NmrA-like family protein n=1 Tax=Candidatus Nitrosocosmicus franklandianus TaxID=1798806 RepID=A0A484I7V1_9ARCH|nr:NAD-dependent epimerase/dehydratase family protein [Candidatus Nitrosocosmicus franklandus]VFJ13271.1 NmrA-like family protein [Candidatus Nitrosocosmicus franklandus]